MRMDQYATGCLERAWPHLAALVARIARLLGGDGPFTRALRSQALKLIRPAESLARRLLILKAVQRSLAPAGPARPGTIPPAPPAASSRRPQPPRLALTEKLPRCDWISETPFPEPEPRTRHVLDNARLAEQVSGALTLSRLAALQDVIARPAHHAARMARWLARNVKPGSRRPYPLAPGTPVGAVKHPPDPAADEALRDAHYYVRKTFWSDTG